MNAHLGLQKWRSSALTYFSPDSMFKAFSLNQIARSFARELIFQVWLFVSSNSKNSIWPRIRWTCTRKESTRVHQNQKKNSGKKRIECVGTINSTFTRGLNLYNIYFNSWRVILFIRWFHYTSPRDSWRVEARTMNLQQEFLSLK